MSEAPPPSKSSTPPLDALGTAVPDVVPEFDEVIVEADGDATVLTHLQEDRFIQNVTLAVSTALFMIFVVILLPALNLNQTGYLLWLLVGVIALGVMGLSTQVRTRSTRIRIDAVGVQIDQGTPIDREHVSIAWREIAAAELEPIDPKRAEKGMQLRIALREGPPVDMLPNVGVGELMATRRLMLERAHRAAQIAAANVAGDAGGEAGGAAEDGA